MSGTSSSTTHWRGFGRQLDWRRILGPGSAAKSTAAVVTGGEEWSADIVGTATTPTVFPEWFDTRLETWDDPTPRESEFTVHDLREACIKAGRRSFRLMDARSLVRPSEEQVRQREEEDRKFLMIALEVYTRKNNMQPTELEFVEVKARNLIDESGLGYLHFNFLVKGLDGKRTMFFAELRFDLEDENDVYVCTPLGEEDFKPSEENDQVVCKACQHEAKDLVHPSCGSFLGGHKNVCTVLRSNFDDDSDYEFI